ncbi:MAG: hypothetical protein Q4G67_03970 [Actinomycetia bacterium]|nr:hypothetical protein [Actinomycetes bacterium]
MSPIREEDLRALLQSDPSDPGGRAEQHHDDRGLAHAVTSQGRTIVRRRRIVGGVGALAAAAAIAIGISTLDLGGTEALTPAQTPTTVATSIETPAPTPTDPPSTATAPTPTKEETEPEGSPSPEETVTENGTDNGTGTASEEPAPPAALPLLYLEGLSVEEIIAEDPDNGALSAFGALPALEQDFFPCDLETARPLTISPQQSKRLGQSFGSGGLEQGLMVFASDGDATATMAEIRSRFSCADSDPVVTNLWSVDGSWDESFGVTLATKEYGYTTMGIYTRTGRAIAWAESSGDGGLGNTDRPPAGMENLLRQPIEHLAPELCRFTSTGC